MPAAVTLVNASNRAPPRRRRLKHGYRDNRRGHYSNHNRVLIGAHVGTGALRAGNPVKIGKDGGKVNPSVNSSASCLRMKIVGRRRSINEQRVRADLVYADREAGRVRYYGADDIDKVVVKGGARDCGLVSSDGRNNGVIEDVVTDRDVGAGVPKHDLTGFAACCMSEGERVVCYQPVAGSIRQLNRPTSVHVVEDVVDYRHVLGVRIDPVVKV